MGIHRTELGDPQLGAFLADGEQVIDQFHQILDASLTSFQGDMLLLVERAKHLPQQSLAFALAQQVPHLLETVEGLLHIPPRVAQIRLPVVRLAAMVVNDAPVLRAIWNSVGVVLRNFWSTLWLFVLINLIGGGLTILWQQVSHGAWTGLAIVGNAYVGTSLIAASLLFYKDRYMRWQEAVAELLAKQGKQTT